jgi:hypothetical protein
MSNNSIDKNHYKEFVELTLKYKDELDKFTINLDKFSEEELFYANGCIDCVRDFINVFDKRILKLFADRESKTK